jgi:hypothetical protein
MNNFVAHGVHREKQRSIKNNNENYRFMFPTPVRNLTIIV